MDKAPPPETVARIVRWAILIFFGYAIWTGAFHGHGFQHLDVGAGGSHQRRDHEGGALVGGANVGDETIERDAGLREIGGDGVLLMVRSGDDV